ncbi:hypothetical protein Cgig2_001166 [Carnegiea gigantea]|uniref:RRM domain-containing protein n=1 Tax=Carnegiea gigantea TaxID=171969 RepID=A0A9Q1GL25_9CARY|nr:hypothetical protein Cgig2_001166 [Carnegiea gigantea]
MQIHCKRWAAPSLILWSQIRFPSVVAFLKSDKFPLSSLRLQLHLSVRVCLQFRKGEMRRPIFCGNFEFEARSSDLERLFKRYGRVERVDMKSGFAFVYMEDERDAECAIRALDRTEFGKKGRRLHVEWTKQERRGRKSASSRRSANLKPSKTLFVINFPYHTKERDLERHFDLYGKILNVRMRRNFAFVQYESLEDATKALDATNMSKMSDRVISVEYASREDDERRNGYNPDRRGLDRSPDRRKRSSSPYRRERASPDYGTGCSPAAYRRDRGSPGYGHGSSRSPRRVERGSPDYDRGAQSLSPRRKKRASADYRDRSQSPRGGGRNGSGYARCPSTSPSRREEASPGHLNGASSPHDTPDLRGNPAGAAGSPADDIC